MSDRFDSGDFDWISTYTYQKLAEEIETFEMDEYGVFVNNFAYFLISIFREMSECDIVEINYTQYTYNIKRSKNENS